MGGVGKEPSEERRGGEKGNGIEAEGGKREKQAKQKTRERGEEGN